jgi:hypothetical protein
MVHWRVSWRVRSETRGTGFPKRSCSKISAQAGALRQLWQEHTAGPRGPALLPAPLAGSCWGGGTLPVSESVQSGRASVRFLPFCLSQNWKNRRQNPFQSASALVHTARTRQAIEPKGDVFSGCPGDGSIGAPSAAARFRFPAFLSRRATVYRGVEQPGSSSGS